MSVLPRQPEPLAEPHARERRQREHHSQPVSLLEQLAQLDTREDPLWATAALTRLRPIALWQQRYRVRRDQPLHDRVGEDSGEQRQDPLLRPTRAASASGELLHPPDVVGLDFSEAERPEHRRQVVADPLRVEHPGAWVDRGVRVEPLVGEDVDGGVHVWSNDGRYRRARASRRKPDWLLERAFEEMYPGTKLPGLERPGLDGPPRGLS